MSLPQHPDPPKACTRQSTREQKNNRVGTHTHTSVIVTACMAQARVNHNRHHRIQAQCRALETLAMATFTMRELYEVNTVRAASVVCRIRVPESKPLAMVRVCTLHREG